MRLPGDTGRPNRDACHLNDIARVAESQRGIITHAELLSLGLTLAAIQRLRRRGYLRPLYRGVYAVGHLALPPGARELAAVLACGPDALLSHHSAAAMWGLVEIDAPLQVTVFGRHAAQRAGLVVHRSRAVGPAERAICDGIPITSPARTLIDLAAVVSPRQLQRAFDEACVQGRLTPAQLRAALTRHPRCPGAARLRALIADDRAGGFSHEGTEVLMRELIRRAGLPAPDRNVALGRWSLDLYWPAQRVAVELDSFDFHTTRSAFERDHEKDHVLRARDIDLLRFTWHQVHGQPERTLARLVTALARPRRAA